MILTATARWDSIQPAFVLMPIALPAQVNLALLAPADAPQALLLLCPPARLPPALDKHFSLDLHDLTMISVAVQAARGLSSLQMTARTSAGKRLTD